MGNFRRMPAPEHKLTNGFYIEVRNKGSKDRGIRIRSGDKDAMKDIAAFYAKNKTVLILGEYKDEKWV